MDQDRAKNPGTGGTGQGSSGWSPTSQPRPASGPSSISQTGSSGGGIGSRGGESGIGQRGGIGQSGAGQSYGGSAGSRVGGVGGDTQSRGSNIGGQSRGGGPGLVHKAQEKISSTVDQQKGRIADEIGAVGTALHSAAGKLEQEHGATGRYAQMAADQIDGLADYLRDMDPDRMAGEVQRFARHRPELFLGGAIIAGMLLGRFLRSHEPRPDYERFRGETDFSRDFDETGTYGSSEYGRPARIEPTGYGTGTSYSTGSAYGAGTSYGTGGTGGTPGLGDKRGTGGGPSNPT